MSDSGILGQIKGTKTTAFRKLEIKRRNSSDGLFEANWFDITSRVEKWGKISKQLDPAKPNKITFRGAKVTVDNSQGEFNPESDPGSFWDGYLTQQRTLIKVSAGFIHETLSSSGIWTNDTYPQGSEYDSSLWDAPIWDAVAGQNVFTGILSGDIVQNDTNKVNLTISPLMQVFRDYPAQNLDGYHDTLTASEFMTMLRDQTDGAGSFVFRPFFGDTTSNWLITTTTVEYPNLSTGTADDVRNSTVLDIIEKLAEAEGFVAFVDKDARFRFENRDATSTVAYNFFGRGFVDNQYGHTIKKVSSFGNRISRFYSRVRVQYLEASTSTSFYIKESSFSVSPLSTAWQFGYRTLDVNNIWIQNASAAQTIGDALFNELSSLKREIAFTTSFIPHLDVLNRVKISYDSAEKAFQSNFWDVNNWSPGDNELTWFSSDGDSISLDAVEFKLFSVEINLDNLECKFVGREI